jgi:hypothetical protein
VFDSDPYDYGVPLEVGAGEPSPVGE